MTMRRTCPECGHPVALTVESIFISHSPYDGEPMEDFHRACEGSRRRPLKPGGGSLHATPSGLPSLGKKRR